MTESGSFYNKDIGAIISVFKGFLTPERFKEIANEHHRLRVKYNSTKQLNDIQAMNVLSSEVQEWISNEWFDDARKTGLKFFAFVVPKDVFGKLSMENANKDTSATNGIEIQYFDNLFKAKDWLKAK